MLFRSAFAPLALLALLLPRPSAAQEYTFSTADGIIIPLADGRIAVLKSEAGKVVVGGIVAGEKPAGPAIDIRQGDRVLGMQQEANPSLDWISATYDKVTAGGEILFRLQRGAAAPHTIRFPRPDVAPGTSTRAVKFNGRPTNEGTGAWTSAESPGSASELAIAGAKIRNNNEGLPEVVSRGSHPAASEVPLRTGDVINAVNGKSIAALAGLEKYYKLLEPGAEVVLTVIREGQPKSITFRKPSE